MLYSRDWHNIVNQLYFNKKESLEFLLVNIWGQNCWILLLHLLRIYQGEHVIILTLTHWFEVLLFQYTFRFSGAFHFNLSKYSWDGSNFSYFESVSLVLKNINNFHIILKAFKFAKTYLKTYQCLLSFCAYSKVFLFCFTHQIAQLYFFGYIFLKWNKILLSKFI